MRTSDAGWFGPGSATWRVNGEAALMLGAGRALILQASHPMVGAGIARYSRYHVDRWGRLAHTRAAIGEILFGDAQTAQRAAARIRRAHRRIQGVVDAGSAAGSAYRATDSGLVLWVWATCVDSWLVTYQRYVGHLRQEEIERFYAEQKRFAYACGVDDGACPASFADFTAYVQRTIAETLEPTAAARDVIAMALNPLGLPKAAAALIGVPLRLPTIGMLPAGLRERLGLRWTRTNDHAFRGTAWACRLIVPWLPRRLRFGRSARRAAQRLIRVAPATPSAPSDNVRP